MYSSTNGEFLRLIFFQVRGQDFIIDLLGITDILFPVAALMTNCQAIDLRPWKIAVWFPKVIEWLKMMKDNLEDVCNKDDAAFSEHLFPR